jgi:hypothetical protein
MPKSPDLTLPLAEPITLARGPYISGCPDAAAKRQTDPTLEPRKAENGTGYYIVVTWSDGRTEQLSGFKDETAALDWIRLGSRAWIARRKKKRRDHLRRPDRQSTR